MSRSLFLPAALATGLLASQAAFADNTTVAIDHVWSRAQIAGRNGAVFLTLTGKGTGDRLVGVSSPVAEKAELHETIMDQGIIKMREVQGMPIAAGGTVTLAPGGLHIMLMGLKQPLKEGESVSLTLVFEKAGPVPTNAKIEKAGAAAPSGDAMHGHGHGQWHR
jgi:copper(I)-binding protein